MEKVALLAAAALMLSGCVTTGTPKLAPIPADIRICFDQLAPMPVKGPISRRYMFAIVSGLKKSEMKQSQCGKRLIAWYETQRKVYGE